MTKNVFKMQTNTKPKKIALILGPLYLVVIIISWYGFPNEFPQIIVESDIISTISNISNSEFLFSMIIVVILFANVVNILLAIYIYHENLMFNKLVLLEKRQKKMRLVYNVFGKNEPVQNSNELMDENKFWKIIEKAKSNSSENDERQKTILKEELYKLTSIEILEFDNKFRKLRGQAHTWNLWVASYILNDDCSEGCFFDFRNWLIGNGKDTYENTMVNVESLAKIEHNQNKYVIKGLDCVARKVYKEKNDGKEMPDGIRENLEAIGKKWNEKKTLII